ncbi:MAG: adenylyltransferase/cytidyltransferase family protein, partial [Nitrospirae bacterium]|nr:adenylyltransferase/cytidyltransferase family protein [Nitrospirota bacterium]
MKRIAICPGTFDPITNGHIDIVMRSLSIFDEIVVAVAPNPKKTPLFKVEDRMALIRESFKALERVTIESFDGLLVNY